MMHMQTAPLPVHFQMLCESSKLYDPGQQYASHVCQLQRGDEPDVRYDFEPYVSTNTWYGQRHGPCGDRASRLQCLRDPPSRPVPSPPSGSVHQVSGHAHPEG